MTGQREVGPVVHKEALDELVDELDDFIKAKAVELRRAHKGQVSRTLPITKEVTKLLDERLREVLEDEVVSAVPVDLGDQSLIVGYELRQEVIKKALVGLKMPALRQVARQAGIPQMGNLENLATRIARYYKWNDEEIARLVLETENEPLPERGYVDRLFAMDEPPVLEALAEELASLLGRYIRIGIARWFVFEKLVDQLADDHLELVGSVRAYQALIEEDDSDHPHLKANPQTDHRLSVVISRDLGIIRVRNASSTDARAAIEALRRATRWSPLGYVPVRVASLSEGTRSRFHSDSLIMLDLITTRFREAGVGRLNLTMARFSMGSPDKGSEPEEEGDRPRLQAVRFEGQHLLASVQACQLLATDRRALVDVSATVMSEPRPDGEVGVYPVRIELERDHLLVFTGFTAHGPLEASEMHRQLRSAAVAEMREGIADPAAIEALGQRIRERARSSISPDHEDILNVEGGS